MKHNNSHNHTLFGIPSDLVICLFIGLITIFVYWDVTNHEFINFDDTLYVTKNGHVQSGLTPDSIAWSFGFSDKDKLYWHPLTWVSHILDCQMYGLNPGMHHLTNLLLHMANSVLLFLVFRLMTGSLWKSAFMAALFAVHPLNVDSVAWVAERKNVLSTFFFILTLLTYAYYCKNKGPSRYLLTFFVFALGLLAKPMLVTLPFVLLLLDYWPLERLHHATIPSAFRPVMEKVPFLFLSIISIYLSASSLKGVDSVISLEAAPMGLRISNALVSYWGYIGKTVWPHNLAVFYPYPSMIPFWKTACAGLFLALVSLLVILAAKQRPYLFVGWFWFLGTFVPVIGLVQAGLWPAMADRWAYIPLVGLFIMVAWGVHELPVGWRHKKTGLAITGAAILSILAAITLLQLRYWKNSITLFEHDLHATTNNTVAHNNLGLALAKENRIDDAIAHYHEALRIYPDYVEAHNNLGAALATQGKLTEATSQFHEAVRINPNRAEVHSNLGLALANQGKLTEAISEFHEAIRLNPDYADAHSNLGFFLAGQNNIDEAITQYLKALQINPMSAEVHNNLGAALMNTGNIAKAIAHFSEAVRIDPDYANAHANLGAALKDQGNITGAITHLSEAVRINPNHLKAHTSLGIILAAQGNTSEAVSHYTRALTVAPDDEEALNNLAWIYATSNNPGFRNGEKAIRLAEHACEVTGHKNPIMLDTLAAAYAEGGQFQKARLTVQKAIDLAESAGQGNVAKDLRKRLKLYISGMPFRE